MKVVLLIVYRRRQGSKANESLNVLGAPGASSPAVLTRYVLEHGLDTPDRA